ncbi:MAG: hypothetical protein RRY23_07320, partial [Alistipes sp.]
VEYVISSLGKVALYQLSYFRIKFQNSQNLRFGTANIKVKFYFAKFSIEKTMKLVMSAVIHAI